MMITDQRVRIEHNKIKVPITHVEVQIKLSTMVIDTEIEL